MEEDEKLYIEKTGILQKDNETTIKYAQDGFERNLEEMEKVYSSKLSSME